MEMHYRELLGTEINLFGNGLELCTDQKQVEFCRIGTN